MSVSKSIREVLRSTLLLKQKRFMAMSPWTSREVMLITKNDHLTREKSTLQIHNLKKHKLATIDVSNFVYVHPNIEEMTITIVLPDDSEIVFKIGSHQLLVLWMAALKVSMSKGKLFHVKYRSRDGMVDEDALLQFIIISSQGSKNPNQILMLSSPLDDITRHAWRVSQIRQFCVTDLGISIEFCHNCYRTHIPQHKSFNLFVHTSILNNCVEFICENAHAVACSETFNNFLTVYRIQDHHCPALAFPPPPVPSTDMDNRPPIPCRDYPRYGFFKGPHARPFLKYPDVLSSYKITNRIVINKDGSVHQESTILGHRGSKSDPNPLAPPRKQNIVQQPKVDKDKCFLQQRAAHHKLSRNASHRLLPPKYIKRTSTTLPYAKIDFNDGDDDDDDVYQENWIANQEEYVHMHPSELSQPPLSHDNLSNTNGLYVQIVNQVSVIPSCTIGTHLPSTDSGDDSLDLMDRDYINVQNILSGLGVKSVSKPPKPAIKKRTFKLIKTEVDIDNSAARYRPPIKPRKSSLNLSTSPKPIPHRRTLASLTNSSQEFNFSEHLQKEDERNVTHDLNPNTEVIESTSQLDIKVSPIMDESAVENYSENDDVFTTTQYFHHPLGHTASTPSKISHCPLQPLSDAFTVDQPSFQKQATVVSLPDASSFGQQTDSSNDIVITGHTSVENGRP